MKDPRKPYDIDMLDGIAACSRLARALLRYRGQLLDTAPMERVGIAHRRYLVRVKFAPDDVPAVEAMIGARLAPAPVAQLGTRQE